MYAHRDASFAFGENNLERTFFVQASLDPNEPIRYGLSYATGYETLYPSDSITSSSRPVATGPPTGRFLSMMNVGYYISVKITHPG